MYRNENGIWANLDVKSHLFKAGPLVSFLNARLSPDLEGGDQVTVGTTVSWAQVPRLGRALETGLVGFAELESFVMLE